MLQYEAVALSCVAEIAGVDPARLKVVHLLKGQQLEFEPLCGHHIADVLDDVMSISKKLNLPIRFKFNDKMTTIFPSDNKVTAELRFRTEGEPLLYLVDEVSNGYKLTDNLDVKGKQYIGPFNLDQLRQLQGEIDKFLKPEKP